MEAVARMLGSEKHKWVQSTGPLGLAGSGRGKHRGAISFSSPQPVQGR